MPNLDGLGGHVVGPVAGGYGGLIGYGRGDVADVGDGQVFIKFTGGHADGPSSIGYEGLAGHVGGVVAGVGGGQVFILVLKLVELLGTLFRGVVLEGGGGHVIRPVVRGGGVQVFMEGVVVGGEGGGILK